MAETHSVRVFVLFAGLVALTGLEIAVICVGLPQGLLATVLIGLLWIALLVGLCFL